MIKRIFKALFGPCIIICILIILLSSLPRPIAKQELHVGDNISGYRNMNRWNSFSCFTSCKEIDYKKFEVTFLQYYDNNPYEFKYILLEEDYICLYSSKIPNKKIKMKVSINSQNKTIVLENEELINKQKNKKKKK